LAYARPSAIRADFAQFCRFSRSPRGKYLIHVKIFARPL
jgi:hypothetical protein